MWTHPPPKVSAHIPLVGFRHMQTHDLSRVASHVNETCKTVQDYARYLQELVCKTKKTTLAQKLQ